MTYTQAIALLSPQKLAIGRWLLHQKASLPHGHFGPWLEKQEGLSRGMGHQCMRLATGGHKGEGTQWAGEPSVGGSTCIRNQPCRRSLTCAG
ncbi:MULTISPECIES: DUF3102 domain-containing protein [unclassified Mesorhizobium]|uniref:DUF3102 domain-containing protein n=1 Tax=unclassified Mesorhizobium TaxID=325217 RepID=UPI00112E1696|nr:MULTISPECIES: DUF3102 domain-containing protein [unclassified Mesorhizobium]TPN57327.1 DUF3102 domain-containing protein [Mesorhizobium sp. B1-1-7]TPN57727.1 DUF3102 domain-containing protein [Mesorhizobium sp. B1-1-9]